MSNIDVSKVVTTTQEYDNQTGEMVTKVTHVGSAVKDKKVGQILSRVKVDPPEQPTDQVDTVELENRIKKLEQIVEDLKKNQNTAVSEDSSNVAN